jgi:hypothetical protein
VAAHWGVLLNIPYFWSRLSKDWAQANFNFNTKLKIQLPAEASRQALQAFLRHVYGDPSPLRELHPITEISSMHVNESLRMFPFVIMCREERV